MLFQSLLHTARNKIVLGKEIIPVFDLGLKVLKFKDLKDELNTRLKSSVLLPSLTECFRPVSPLTIPSISSSAIEQCFYEWVPVLFVHMSAQEDTYASPASGFTLFP